MTSIAFDFLAGRYHATGWDHHVNEGSVEWPPSPWRILRALVAAAYRSNLTEEARPVIEKLGALPTYRLAPATLSHTRHYMPIGGRSPTKVFDAFVALGGIDDSGRRENGRLTVMWDVTLADVERAVLAKLARHLPYLGRAESWVEAAVVADPTEPPDARPAASDDDIGAASVSLQALQEDAVRESELGAVRAGLSKKAKTWVPSSSWEVLHADTGQLQKDGWSRAPGTRFVRYVHARDPFPAPGPARRRRIVELPIVARYAVDSAVLPSMTAALSLGERLRGALMKWSRDDDGSSADVFSGHGITGDHQHALFLSVDRQGHGRIDELVVYARGGFDERARRALESVRKVWGHDGHDVFLTLLGIDTNARDSLIGGTATVWRSATPFVCFRHTKRRGGRRVDTPEDQVRLAARRWCGEEPEVVAFEPPGAPWHRFQRRRRDGGGARGNDGAHGFRLHFRRPIEGPLSLGYGAHFGLGSFVPE